ncbi:MAG: hypothetical protein U0326_24080 [Polyangiales bacterium]
MHSSSVLLVTLDSCRYDTAASASTPSLRTLGEPVRAMAPSYFTLASHAAIWVGATPGVPGLRVPWLNPKWRRLFRLETHQIKARDDEAFALTGRTIIEGFNNGGYATMGTGAVDWFDTKTASGRALVEDFAEFRFAHKDGVGGQVEWLASRVREVRERPVFAFLNAGETHVPYWHEGAAWLRADNPCVPFGATNRREVCELRQRACLEHIDAAIGPMLAAFRDATVMVTADHGDCWGEDGLWEHGVWHAKAMEVPLWLRVRGRVVRAIETPETP